MTSATLLPITEKWASETTKPEQRQEHMAVGRDQRAK